MGFQKAKEIIYFAKKLTAQDCCELNIANAVLPHDDLMGHVFEQARQLIPPGGANYAIQQMKQVFHKPYKYAVEQALDLENGRLNNCWSSADFAEALTARFEKRAPVYTGK